MNSSNPTPEDSQPSEPQTDTEAIAAERGIPSVNRVRSMQARVTGALAIATVVIVGGGFLSWYYWGRAEKPAQQRRLRALPDTTRESVLPALAIAHERPKGSQAVVEQGSPSPSSTLQALLAPAPEIPAELQTPSDPKQDEADLKDPADEDTESSGESPEDLMPAREPSEAEHRSVELARQRRLAAPAFVSFTGDVARTNAALEVVQPEAVAADSEDELGQALKAPLRPAVSAERLADLHLILPTGATLDCSLETAIDTALPGLVACILSADVYGADGKVLLLERGSTLFGQTKSIQSGEGARVFVLWDEVRSPFGIIARLASPGTDALGRSGLPGAVNRHFWERFSAAFLVSVIDGGVKAATPSRGTSVVLNPEENEALLTEVLRSTADLKPTKSVAPGAHLAVLVARDVDFSSVYRLKSEHPDAR